MGALGDLMNQGYSRKTKALWELKFDKMMKEKKEPIMEKVQENYWNYEQRPTDTKPCPHCGKQMVTEMSSMVMTSNPPQQRWYWECECGYQELGGVHVHDHVKQNVMI